MILNVLQVAAIAVAAICLYRFRAGLRRRNAQSWDSLVARLRLNGPTRRLGDRSVWNGDMNVTPEEKWQLVRGAQGLWTMYENASVMLEMADYAARTPCKSESASCRLLQSMHSARSMRASARTCPTRHRCTQRWPLGPRNCCR